LIGHILWIKYSLIRSEGISPHIVIVDKLWNLCIYTLFMQSFEGKDTYCELLNIPLAFKKLFFFILDKTVTNKPIKPRQTTELKDHVFNK
jgi:hypothetical protein